MKLRIKSTLLFILFALNGYSQVTNNLTLVWSDEFNGNTLDATKWAPAPEWPRQGGSFWSDNNYDMTGNGQVRLKVTEENGKVYCGAIRTHNLFDKTYGYFETRCKLPEIQGGWAAFWLMPYGNKVGGWGNDGTEMDVFESINGWNGKINHALHWDGYGADHQKESQSKDRPDLYDNKYHTFGMMWTPDEYIFYIDNVESWRTSAGGVSDVKQYLKLTLEVSGDTWAGNWNNQVTKPIYWLVDYVRVYDYEPVVATPQLSYKSLQSGQSYQEGESIKMHVDVSGDLSGIDQLKFTSLKSGGTVKTLKTSAVSTETTYWHGWTPTEHGSYVLKVEAYMNGVFVTNVVANIIVEEDNSLNLSFTTLGNGQTYNVGDDVVMDTKISGDLSGADELRFISDKTGGSSTIVKTSNVTNNMDTYFCNWIPMEPGSYVLKVLAFKNSVYITTVVVNVTVEDPLELKFKVLENGQVYSVGDEVKMHVELYGDTTQADEIRFTTQKSGEAKQLVKTYNNLNSSENIYWYKWTPTSAGNYTLKALAYKDDVFISNVVATVTVNDIITNIQADVVEITTLAYPNPTDGIVSLKIESQFDFVVLDLKGRQKMTGSNTAGKNLIDLSSLVEGDYVLKVTTPKTTQTIKITKI